MHMRVDMHMHICIYVYAQVLSKSHGIYLAGRSKSQVNPIFQFLRRPWGGTPVNAIGGRLWRPPRR